MKKSLFKILSGSGKKGKNKVAEPAKPDFNPEEIYPKLYIPNEDAFENEDIYILKYKHGKLEPLKENQLQLQTYAVELADDNIVAVHAFIRHGVPAEIQLEDASIVLRDANENSLLKQHFSLTALGALPPLSSVVHEFLFDISTLTEGQKQNIEKWSIGFEVQTPHQLVYDAAWENNLTDEQKDYFQTVFDQCPAVGEDEVNFMLVSAQKLDGSIHVTVMIRNGKKQNVEISQLPLILQDAESQSIAQGTFRLDKFVIPANTSKPWVFVFPKETILMDCPLENVKLTVPQ